MVQFSSATPQRSTPPHWSIITPPFTNSSGNLLPSLVQMAPSPVAVLDTSYGAAWVWMWNQRERSLTPPCSLMALTR